MPKRLPRIRLRHLFALVTLAAVLVWLWPKVGLEVDHKPGVGSSALLIWMGDPIKLWDTYEPPPVFGYDDSIVGRAATE